MGTYSVISEIKAVYFDWIVKIGRVVSSLSCGRRPSAKVGLLRVNKQQQVNLAPNDRNFSLTSVMGKVEKRALE